LSPQDELLPKGEAQEKGLLKNGKQTAACTRNVVSYMDNHGFPWDGAFRFNILTRQIELMTDDLPGVRNIYRQMCPRPIRDGDIIGMTSHLQGAMNCWRVNKTSVLDACVEIAERFSVNPILEYLDSLIWDGKQRLETMFQDYFGSDDTAFIRAAGFKWMLSLVRRAQEPGIQADSMIVLEGPQGIGKTTFLRTLGAKWYGSLFEPPHSKDARMKLNRLWVCEIPEIEGFMGERLEAIKQYVSETIDILRVPYGRAFDEFPRVSVFAGTTNTSEYLTDATGARRFWPIRVRQLAPAFEFDYRQLLAEAVHEAQNQHELHWFSDKDAALFEEIKETQEGARVNDPWEELIESIIEGRSQVTSGGCLAEMGLRPSERNRAAEMRVGRVLTTLGWQRKRLMQGGKRSWIYVPPVSNGVDTPGRSVSNAATVDSERSGIV